ncbi:MAG: lysylphosphatidylglycerol synthase transmembrane domain-containing protein [Gemmatimonadaceae bacterium]
MTALNARRLAAATGAILLLALLVFAARRIDVGRVVAELRTVRASWIFAALLCYVSILPLWALQWRLLAPQTDRNTFRRMLGVIAMTSSTHNTAAFFVGEATGGLLLATHVGLGRSAALSVIAMDQLLVGIAKLGVLSTAALTLTLPSWMSNGIAALALGVFVLLLCTVLAAWQYETIGARAERFVPARAVAAMGSIGQALAPLRSLPRGGGALALALLKMFVETLAMICIQRAFGLDLPFTSAVLVLATLNLATLVPVVPGNLGVYEGAVVLIYTRLGVPAEQAVGMAVVQHACFFAALALPGYAWLVGAGASRSAAAAL